MIAFNGKNNFAGCMARIAEAGHYVQMVDNVMVASDPVAVQAIIDGYTLDMAKAEKSLAVSMHAKLLRERVTASIAPGEMASWPIKRDEAQDYVAMGEQAKCPALRQEAAARGVSLAELVAKVNANAARFMGAEAAIGGADGKHRDTITGLATFEAVAAYDFSAGWPVV